MSPRATALAALSACTLFVGVLIAIMVSLWLNAPQSGPFDQQFSLIDDQGHPVDRSVFKGHPALVYFGYTNCPEACPTTLLEVSDWLNALGEQGKSLKVYFFSIDPQRDTQSVMHDYVTTFGPRITGITGRPEEMKKVADGWMIHVARLPSEDGNYHMSHTVSLLMVGADGRLKGLIPYGTDRSTALDTIRSSLLKTSQGV